MSNTILFIFIKKCTSSKSVIKSFLNFITEYRNLKKAINKIKSPNPTSSKGFFPLNVSVTMDGLAGIKIYQKLKIDTSFLPSNYPNVLEFIIKGVTHKIENNVWSTMVETVSVPVIEPNVTANTSTPAQSAPAPQPTTPQPNNNTQSTPPPQPTAPKPSNNSVQSKPASRNTINTEPISPANTDCSAYIQRFGLKQRDKNGNLLKYIKAKNFDICMTTRSLTSLSKYKKTQLVLHHTAGWPSLKSGAFGGHVWWNTCAINGVPNQPFGWAPGSAFMLNGIGEILRMPYEDSSWYTQGNDTRIFTPYGNAVGIGIEIENPGPLAYVQNPRTKKMDYMDINVHPQYLSSHPGLTVSHIVDWNLKPLRDNKNLSEWWPSYCPSIQNKGDFRYGLEFTDAQIKTLRSWILEMINKYSMKPFKWEGEKTWKAIFPPRQNTYDCTRSTISNHKCWYSGKTDALPTEKLVRLLIELGR